MINAAERAPLVRVGASLKDYLINLIEQLGLASGDRIPEYRFPETFAILNAMDGMGYFRRQPNRRQALDAFEHLCGELTARPIQPPTISRRIEDTLHRRRYVCASQLFQVVVLRGSGDLRIKILDSRLHEQLNAVLSAI